jgi:hypothetical protein
MTIPADYGDVDWLLDRVSNFHRESRHVEREYLELRTLLRDAQAVARTDPTNSEVQLRMHYLKRRLEVLEEKHPWLLAGKPPEIAFWMPPSG